MNARKVLLFLAGLVVAFVAAIIAVSLFTLQKMESEKNAAKTQKAREARWKRQEAETTSNLAVSPDGIVDEPKPEENATGQITTDPEED